MIFLSTQINWEGAILDEGPRLCLLLADRIGQEIGPIGRAVFLLGFWGAAFSSVMGVYHGVPFLFDDMLHVWRRQPAGGPARPGVSRVGGVSGARRDLGAPGAAAGLARVRLHGRRLVLLPVRHLDAALAQQLQPRRARSPQRARW